MTLNRITMGPSEQMAYANGYSDALSKMKRQPIETAPRTATEVILFVPIEKGSPRVYRVIGHWADGGGDEQPRFRGWFRATGYGYVEIPEPTHWAPLPKLEDH